MVALSWIGQRRPDISMKATQRIVRGVLSVMLFFSGTRIIREGLDNIPDTPSLFVANHRSYYDTFIAYMCMPAPTGFVAKKELQRIPFLRQWMRLMGSVFLDRTDIKEGLKAILEAIDKIKQGYSMVIFPEGTRNKDPDRDVPGEFREGSLKIAKKARCMVVPVAIKDTERCFESHIPWVRGCRVRITFLKPFFLDDIPDQYKKVPATYVRQLIADDLRRPL